MWYEQSLVLHSETELTVQKRKYSEREGPESCVRTLNRSLGEGAARIRLIQRVGGTSCLVMLPPIFTGASEVEYFPKHISSGDFQVFAGSGRLE